MISHIVSYTVLIALIAAFFFAMRRIMYRDNVINSLIIAFYDNQTIDQKELISIMYQYACSDIRLKKLIVLTRTQTASVMLPEKVYMTGNSPRLKTV